MTDHGVAMRGAGPARPRAGLLRGLLRSRAGIAAVVLILPVAAVGLLAGVISPGNPKAPSYPTFVAPSRSFLMGTDDQGRAMLPMVVHGIATSMVTVLAVVAISAAVGVTVGAVAGYGGGVLDGLLMRFVDMVQSVPSFFLAIVAIAVLGSGQDKLILLLGLTSWTILARIVRAQVLSLKRREFVQATRALGASSTRIVVRHVLPNVVPAVVVILPLLASRVVIIEAGLAFLGLGDPNRVSLGYLISNAQRYLQYYWWMSVFPGLALVALVLGFNLLGDAFNAALSRAPGAAPAAARGARHRIAAAAAGGRVDASAALD